MTQSSHWVFKPLFYLFTVMALVAFPVLVFQATKQPDAFTVVLIMILAWPAVIGATVLFYFLIFTRELSFASDGVRVRERRAGKTRSWQAKAEDFKEILYGLAKPVSTSLHDHRWLAVVILVHPDKDKSILLYCHVHHFGRPDIQATKRRADHYATLFGLPARRFQ